MEQSRLDIHPAHGDRGRPVRMLAIVVALACVLACVAMTLAPRQAEAEQVSITLPNGQSNVPLNCGAINFYFGHNVAVNLDSIRSLFYLVDENGSSAPFSVYSNWTEDTVDDFTGERRNVYLQPGTLEPGMTYTVGVQAGVQSKGGHYYDGASMTFSTVAPSGEGDGDGSGEGDGSGDGSGSGEGTEPGDGSGDSSGGAAGGGGSSDSQGGSGGTPAGGESSSSASDAGFSQAGQSASGGTAAQSAAGSAGGSAAQSNRASEARTATADAEQTVYAVNGVPQPPQETEIRVGFGWVCALVMLALFLFGIVRREAAWRRHLVRPGKRTEG